MPTNFYMFFVVALIPLILGAIYYHPKLAGTAWMKSNGFSQEDIRGGNMVVIFGLTYLLSLFLAFLMPYIVIHETGVAGLMMPELMEEGSQAQKDFGRFLSQYGGRYRTFGHGAIHGMILGLFGAAPILGILTLFERRGFKYFAIHLVYWLVCLILMGGTISATLVYATVG